MSEVFRDQIGVSVVAISHSTDMHDTAEAVTEHSQDILVVNDAMILDLSLDLNLVAGLFIGTRSQNLQHNEGTIFAPVLRQVDLCISTFINFLLDLVALINHDGLSLRGPWVARLGLLCGLLRSLLERSLGLLEITSRRALLSIRLLCENFTFVDSRQLIGVSHLDLLRLATLKSQLDLLLGDRLAHSLDCLGWR